MEEVCGLCHLFITVFLYCFANQMVAPAITDVTMEAVCPGKDECSLSIYLTGAQQAVIGTGSVVVMPMIGKLSDTYGRKVMLTLPISLSVIPLVILAYNRTTYYFYTYYVLKTLIAMASEGTVQFLAFAYVADNVEVSRRGSVFGVMSGCATSSFVFGNFSARLLSTSATFQVAAAVSIIVLLYMRVFLRESIPEKSVSADDRGTDCLLKKAPITKWKFFKNLPCVSDTICLLRTSPTFSKAALIVFFSNAADVSFYASLMYYLKYRFQFNKDQFADLMIILNVAGSISQLILMPICTPLIGEEKMLSIGLFFRSAQMILISFGWSPWVPYAAVTLSILATFTQPCIRSIASKQIGPSEQGKAQGCITGICSLAKIVSPFAFSPLTALFLSDNAPFHFPGFSILCCSFAAIIALTQSFTIRPIPRETLV